MMLQTLLPILAALPVTLILWRVFSLMYTYDKRLPTTRRVGTRTRLLVVLGSGGHTTEMFSMLQGLDPTRFTHRSYVISSGDAFSARRAEEFEHALAVKAGARDPDSKRSKLYGQVDAAGSFDVCVVPRARRVHQSLLTTPFSVLECLWHVFGVLSRPTTNPSSLIVLDTQGSTKSLPAYAYPDLIVTNGPGTGVVVVLAALCLRFMGVGAASRMRTVYVESWARVSRLSLSGRILLRFVDRFLVQWEKLVEVTGGRAEYYGWLI